LVASIFAIVLAAAAAGATYAVKEGQLSDAQKQVSGLQSSIVSLEDRVRRLSYNTASGGGVNLKLMPDPETGQATVPLEEVFTFDRNQAMCRVDTNPQAFKMQTYSMGEIVIEPYQFFMSMVTTSIEKYEVSTLSDGSRQVTMRGGLSCATEVGQANVKIGSRTAAEHANYKIVALDAGIGGGDAGDTFAFTVFFDPEDAPVNHAIFGPEFTFTGQMVVGEVTITDPRQQN